MKVLIFGYKLKTKNHWMRFFLWLKKWLSISGIWLQFLTNSSSKLFIHFKIVLFLENVRFWYENDIKILKYISILTPSAPGFSEMRFVIPGFGLTRMRPGIGVRDDMRHRPQYQDAPVCVTHPIEILIINQTWNMRPRHQWKDAFR